MLQYNLCIKLHELLYDIIQKFSYFQAVEAGKKAKTSAQERANEEARLRAEEDAKHKADSAASQAVIFFEYIKKKRKNFIF